MTNEEIINSFPECSRIKKENIAECINKLFDDIKYYQDIYNYIIGECNKYFPEPKEDDWKSDYYKEYSDYFYGTIERTENGNFIEHYEYSNWVHSIEDEFIYRNGWRRNFLEACNLAADEWTKRILGFHLQDNGALDEEHSFNMCMLGSYLKTLSSEKYDENTYKTLRENIKEYFLNGCKYKFSDGREHKAQLYCDYHPNSPLFDLLIKSGIDERDADNLCPWKTGIEIDYKDYAIIIKTYQKREYI